MYPEYQDRSGFIPKESMKIPRPVQFQLPKKHILNMHPIELDRMLFLNENYLPPMFFHHFMKWLFKAQRMKNCHGKNQAPSYQTLKKGMINFHQG